MNSDEANIHQEPDQKPAAEENEQPQQPIVEAFEQPTAEDSTAEDESLSEEDSIAEDESLEELIPIFCHYQLIVKVQLQMGLTLVHH